MHWVSEPKEISSNVCETGEGLGYLQLEGSNDNFNCTLSGQPPVVKMAKCMCFHLATLCLNNYREDILKITPALSKNIINEEPSEEKLISATTVRMHPREITLLDSLIRWGIVPAPSRAQFFFEAFLQQLRLLDDIIKKFEDITGSRRETCFRKTKISGDLLMRSEDISKPKEGEQNDTNSN